MWSDLHNKTSMSNFSLSAWATPTHPQASAVAFDDHHATHNTNPNTSSPCEDDISISNSSFTNASGHSVLTIESSRGPIMETTASSNELMNGDHGTSHHLWSQFLLSDDAGEDSHKFQTDIRANLLDGVSPKSAMPEGLFEKAACDYLKKLDSSYWDNSIDKEYDDSNRSNFIEGSDHTLRSKLSDLLIGDWSIATPHEPNHKMHLLSDYTSGIIGFREYDRYSCKGHDAKPSMKNVEAPYNHQTHIGKYSINIGLHQKGDEVTSSWGSTRRLAGLVSLSNQLISKPLLDVECPNPTASAPNIKPKQGLKINNSRMQVNGGRGHGSAAGNVGRRRKSSFEDGTTSEKLQKKAKQECSSVSTSKMQVQVPKAKLGDRIATLQQIVSPFGKTDTASVLMEAIAYIKYLQEQVQLFISNPYLKTNPNREYPWGGGGIGIERKLEAKADLKSRGLCLVPISWAPQVCRDNVGSDYWAMPYRGVFYR